MCVCVFDGASHMGCKSCVLCSDMCFIINLNRVKLEKKVSDMRFSHDVHS